MKYKREERIKRGIKNKTNFYLFLLFCFLTIGLTVGYSSLNEELKISGEASYRVVREVRINDLRLSETVLDGKSSYLNFGYNCINVGISLPTLESKVVYTVEISNTGNVPVVINDIKEEYSENNIEYEINGIELKTGFINPDASKSDKEIGKPTKITITVKYKQGIMVLPSNTDYSMKLTFNFVKPRSILAKGSSTSSTVFNKTLDKSKIETIEFKPLSEINISEYEESWDASYKNDGSVVACYKINGETGLYNLTIAGIGTTEFPPDSSYLFSNYKSLKTINFGKYIDTSKVTNMRAMFSAGLSSTNSNLTTLDLTEFNTSNVTDISMMFENCVLLSDIIGIEKFDTSKVTSMVYGSRGLFKNCEKLISLNLSNWKIANVINMQNMFDGCSSLITLNIENFDTSKVTDMSYMFSNCSSLATLNLENFNTLDVTNMASMFSNCSSLITLNIENFDTLKVTGMSYMFSNCSSLTALNLKNFDTLNVINMTSMFSNCSSLTVIDLSSFYIPNVTNISFMFYNCNLLSSLDIRYFDFEKVTNYSIVFSNLPANTLIYVNENGYKFIYEKISKNLNLQKV